jgi:hypothetical protein
VAMQSRVLRPADPMKAQTAWCNRFRLLLRWAGPLVDLPMVLRIDRSGVSVEMGGESGAVPLGELCVDRQQDHPTCKK